jgi:UDP-GlcNAc:undecaprenyl-phosphate GlcNAc-1-phosphate transferase
MSPWTAVLAFLVATGLAAAFTPPAAAIARRIGAVVQPGGRGLAAAPTPALGGLAILAAVLVAILLFVPATIGQPHTPHAGPRPTSPVHVWAVALGAVIITLVGAIDDIRPLHPFAKLLGQIAAAAVAVAGGVVVYDVTLPFIGALQFPNTGGVLSAIWLVGLMNVVNFSDGVDGLAAGLTAIDGVTFAIIAFDLGVRAAGVLAALTAGAALGFLFFNFHPARVFMGDAGANLLGYLLGVVAVAGSVKTNAVIALVVPLMILAVPLLDTGFVVAKRLKYRRKPWNADANHFHHRMARIGFSQRRTVAYLYAWTALMAGFALAMRFVPSHHHFVLWRTAILAALGLFVLGASVYLVYVLEILKFSRLRMHDLRRRRPESDEDDLEHQVRKEIETGEFERVRG